MRALALHSRQGREPLRGNQPNPFAKTDRLSDVPGDYPTSRTVQDTILDGHVCARFRIAGSANLSAAGLALSEPILAVGAEALPVTPSGGALFAS